MKFNRLFTKAMFMTIAVTSLCVSIACRESEADAPTPTPPYVIIAQFVTNYSMTLYAPNGSYDAYRNDWHWDNFESTEGKRITSRLQSLPPMGLWHIR